MPPYVQFVVTVGEGLKIRNEVVATFDGRQTRPITTTGQLALDHRKVRRFQGQRRVRQPAPPDYW